jgi:hypothetical protein
MAPRGTGLIALLALALLLAGCTGGGTVSNQPGHFSLSGGGAESGTRSYTWQNPGAAANVMWSGGGTGTVGVTIKDASGTQVFAQSYGGSGGTTGSERTSTGTPGAWSITVTWNAAGGGTLTVDTTA